MVLSIGEANCMELAGFLDYQGHVILGNLLLVRHHEMTTGSQVFQDNIGSIAFVNFGCINFRNHLLN